MTAQPKCRAKGPFSGKRISSSLMLATLLVQMFAGCSGMNEWRKPKEKKSPVSEVQIFKKTTPTRTETTKAGDDVIIPPKSKHDTALRFFDPKTTSAQIMNPTGTRPFYESLVKPDDKPIPVNLNFINGVTIPEMVALFANYLKFQFSVDKEVAGMVSIQVASEMTPEQIWRLLERLLWMNNAFLTYEDGIVWVRPNIKMPKEPKITISKHGESNVSVRVFRLKSVEAKSVMESLKPFATDGGLVSEIQGQNSLLIIDNANNMQKLAEIIETVDRISDTDWHRALFPVENISPSRLRYELEQILTILGFPVAGTGPAPTTTKGTGNTNSNFGAIRMVPLDRIQGMLVMAATKDAIAEVGQWISLLDNSEHSGQEQLFVYQVENGLASDLGETLKAMFNVDLTIQAAKEVSVSEGKGRRTTAATTTRPTSSGGTTTPVRSKTNDDAQQAGPGSVFEINTKIHADDEQNRMMIRATPQVYSMMKAVLQRIDTVPAQVQLQVVISEVRLDDNMTLGAEFNYTAGNNMLGTRFQDMNIRGSKTDENPKIAPTTNGFNYLFSSGDDKFAYLNMMAMKGKVEIVASPTVMVIGNKTAQVKIGEEVPIVTSMYTNVEAQAYSGATNNQVEYKETGALLTITPRITKGGLIQIDFIQELSEVQKTTSSDIQSPTITMRRIETTMALRDGATLVVGGLLNNVSQNIVNSLPILTDVPVLNFLFGTNVETNKRTEIVIMVTGHIVNEETPLEKTVLRYASSIDLVRNAEEEKVYMSKKHNVNSMFNGAKAPVKTLNNSEVIEKSRFGNGADVKVMVLDKADAEKNSASRLNAAELAKRDAVEKEALEKSRITAEKMDAFMNETPSEEYIAESESESKKNPEIIDLLEPEEVAAESDSSIR